MKSISRADPRAESWVGGGWGGVRVNGVYTQYFKGNILYEKQQNLFFGP